MKFKRKSAQESNIFVFGSKRKVIGHAFCEINDRTLYIPYLAIFEQFRDKGQGKLLMKKIIGFGKANNCNIFELNVFNENQTAINLYQKFGFRKIGTIDSYFKMQKSTI